MKHEIKRKTEFEPIEVNITIESKEELACLLRRLNTTTEFVNEIHKRHKEFGDRAYGKEKLDLTGSLWNDLDDIWENLK